MLTWIKAAKLPNSQSRLRTVLTGCHLWRKTKLMIIKLQTPPLKSRNKSSELCLSSFFPQEKVAYLISKEHFKLSRVALFTHCCFPQACPSKGSNIVGVFSPINFPFFLPFSLTWTFLALQYMWSCPNTLQCANCGQQGIYYQSKQVPSLHTVILFFLATKFLVVWEAGAHILHSVTHLQSHVCFSKSLFRCFLKIFSFKKTLHT